MTQAEAGPFSVPVSDGLRACLRDLVDECNESARTPGRIGLAARHGWPAPPLISDDDLDEMCRLLERGGSLTGRFSESIGGAGVLVGQASRVLRSFLQHPDCGLIHVVRFLVMTDFAHPRERRAGFHLVASGHLESYRQARDVPFTLQELAAAYVEVGADPDRIGIQMLFNYRAQFDWEPAAVWPYFADRLEQLEAALTAEQSQGRWRTPVRAGLEVLAKFPEIPADLTDPIWNLAMGNHPDTRSRAQPLADTFPDIDERLTAALASRTFHQRDVAADWIARREGAAWAKKLHQAAKKERRDATLDVILSALERRGESVAAYVSRDKLTADAAKGLKKGLPPALDWFPWSAAPTIHWRETGESVASDVVQWLVIQSFKRKSPEPGAMTRRYAELLKPADQLELGRFVLAAWLDRDQTRKLTDEEARKEARGQAAQWGSAGVPVADIEESLFRELQRQCLSATPAKGILALAGACCDESAVPVVQQYITQWYGYKAAQCKALIAMLSGIDHPSAIHLLLSISHRFRTRSIQDEASKYIDLLAERKGWSREELGDRTMPRAGLDDHGCLSLDYGPRTFTASLASDLSVRLVDEDGKPVKALPAARKTDDADKVKAAKKQLSSTRSQVKKFAKAQAGRFYEAMCCERVWPVDVWRRYLLEHPLAGKLCQRIVWLADEGDATAATASTAFRPLEDGSLTNQNDDEVTLPAAGRIRIVHSLLVSPSLADEWLGHLTDYEVVPLFAQFGRPTYNLPDGAEETTGVEDYQGYQLPAFTLRNSATKRGYTRGEVMDGGWFYHYVKPFSGLGVEARIEFSGSGLPEENRAVVLTRLRFVQTMAGGPRRAERPLPLGEVPGVLLSECHADLRALAEAGSGYNPNWRSVVRW